MNINELGEDLERPAIHYGSRYEASNLWGHIIVHIWCKLKRFCGTKWQICRVCPERNAVTQMVFVTPAPVREKLNAYLKQEHAAGNACGNHGKRH